METPATAVSADLLTREPTTALGLLAAEIDLLHGRLHPADQLLIDVAGGTLVMGRHEVPGLAMLFAWHDADPETTGVALERAAGYLATRRVVRG